MVRGPPNEGVKIEGARIVQGNDSMRGRHHNPARTKCSVPKRTDRPFELRIKLTLEPGVAWNGVPVNDDLDVTITIRPSLRDRHERRNREIHLCIKKDRMLDFGHLQSHGGRDNEGRGERLTTGYAL